MSTTRVTSFQQATAREENNEHVSCPPHHWVITDKHEDGYREEYWECRRCGDAKLVRTAAWASPSRKMSNTSTWTPEDTILGDEEEGDAP